MLSIILKPFAALWTSLHLAVSEFLCWRASRSIRLVRASANANGLTVYTVVRNEAHQLPQFLEHYRALGFTHFCMLDNASTDGSSEFLATQQDVSLYHTNAPFKNSASGAHWHRNLIKRHGFNRWICSVDADEYLVFSKTLGHSIQDVIAQLERAGQKRMFAPMLDLYHIDDGKAEYFDASPEIKQVRPRGCEIWGGVRLRLARQEDSKNNGPMLTKYPLSYHDRQTVYTEPHFPYPHARNSDQIYARLLHRKLTAWSLSRIEAEIDGGQHWNDGADYKAYRRWVGLPLRGESSKRYRGPDDLVAAGLLREGPINLLHQDSD